MTFAVFLRRPGSQRTPPSCQRKLYCTLPRKPASSNCEPGPTAVPTWTPRPPASPPCCRPPGATGCCCSEPENFAWLTSGAVARGLPDPASAPAVYCNGERGRWLIARNVDSQRLFDEEMDGLGFQLKEWPWHWGREQLLADLCQNRRVASRPAVGRLPRRGRRGAPTAPLAERLRAGVSAGAGPSPRARPGSHLPQPRRNDTEREIAGQLGHRLMHRGAVAGPHRRRGRRPLAPLPPTSASPRRRSGSTPSLTATGPQVRPVRDGQPLGQLRPASTRSSSRNTTPSAASAPATWPRRGRTPCRARS